jgi:5-methylcytosine-specific restriction endonuclease McrA
MILYFLEKAEIIATDTGRTIRTISTQYPYPSIIRLTRYKRVPYRGIMLSRKNIIRRDGNRCQYCGSTNSPLTVDHVLPKSRGGSDTWENLVTACVRCNNTKSDRSLVDAGMKLRSVPRRPSHVSFIVYSIGAVNEQWKPYLFMH